MTDSDLDSLRGRGFAVAYRMLGTVSDAEDVAQEALLRLTAQDPPPDEPAAWITTVATRLGIDHLRSARVRRETYVGPWLPEPLLADDAPGPAQQAELADSLSQAFLVLAEQLSPLERAAFLLREVFGYEYGRVAEVLERSEATCRQLVARARRHLDAGRPRFDPDVEAGQALLEEFLAAAEEGDTGGLERMLAEDVVVLSDGGGKAAAARRPVVGAAKVARFMVGITRTRREYGGHPVLVNGRPGWILRTPDGAAWDVLSVDVVDGRIAAMHIQRNPDKLRHLA
jgi:RNA polymerase sigma-70 factor (ECF subfamily)